MPQLRGDILRLLEEMDKLIDHSKKNLFQFEVEAPLIPQELVQDFIKLTQISVSAAESVIPAAKSYFNEPATVSEKIHRVFFLKINLKKISYKITICLFVILDHLISLICFKMRRK